MWAAGIRPKNMVSFIPCITLDNTYLTRFYTLNHSLPLSLGIGEQEYYQRTFCVPYEATITGGSVGVDPPPCYITFQKQKQKKQSSEDCPPRLRLRCLNVSEKDEKKGGMGAMFVEKKLDVLALS